MSNDQTQASLEKMKLDPSVVDAIVALAAAEVEGVASVAAQAPVGFISRLMRRKPTAKIESVYDEDGKVSITLHIEVYYGYPIAVLADKLRNTIADALSVQVGVDVKAIDIYVDGIRFNQN